MTNPTIPISRSQRGGRSRPSLLLKTCIPSLYSLRTVHPTTFILPLFSQHASHQQISTIFHNHAVLGEIAKQESLVRAVCGAEGIATFTNFPFFPPFPKAASFPSIPSESSENCRDRACPVRPFAPCRGRALSTAQNRNHEVLETNRKAKVGHQAGVRCQRHCDFVSS